MRIRGATNTARYSSSSAVDVLFALGIRSGWRSAGEDGEGDNDSVDDLHIWMDIRLVEEI